MWDYLFDIQLNNFPSNKESPCKNYSPLEDHMLHLDHNRHTLREAGTLLLNPQEPS